MSEELKYPGSAYITVEVEYLRKLREENDTLKEEGEKLTSCREHWKNSYWDRKIECDTLKAKLEVAREAFWLIEGRNNRPDADTAREALAEIEKLEVKNDKS